jgi:RNA polymerase sigma-70 factor (ECF subfamily)
MIEGVMDGARARFWAGLGEARRADLGALPGWERRLDAALDDPACVFDAGWLARDEFGAELAARLDEDDEEAGRWWDHLHPADLYLASACARGVAPAIAAFERLFGEEIARTARRFERAGLAAEDLLQLLRAKLFTAPARNDAGPRADGADDAPEARPRIASYTGQGFLQNWVRVTATRTFIDCTRSAADAPEIPIGHEMADGLPEPGADPELQLLKREHLSHFKAAFAEGVRALDSSDRLVLKQHLVDRLTVDQIGGLYHLHRATAARRLAKAREALLDATRAALARRLGLAPERLGGVLELVASRLEASVERLLR